MKKIIPIIILILMIYIYNNKISDVLIPDEAIRFRVIANSDTKEDQTIKKLVKDDLEKEITTDLKNSSSIDETRKIINNNLDKYENVVFNSLSKNNSNETFSINYGLNYFPEKEYKGVKYPEGNYESLVVTLGEGKGKNWWCCLFPPLCLLEAEENETEEVEYKFFIKELIDKYFK